MRLAVLTFALVMIPAPAMATPDFTEAGLGSLRLGMPATRAAALGWIEGSTTACNGGWQTARYRKSLWVGVWNGKVMVIATQSRRFRTSKGVRPGDSLKKLRAKYSVSRVGTNIYTDRPVYGSAGQPLFFPARKGAVQSLELADGFVPDGTEFEC